MFLDGKEVRITSPAMAQRLGIGFVHQEIALCPDVTRRREHLHGRHQHQPRRC